MSVELGGGVVFYRLGDGFWGVEVGFVAGAVWLGQRQVAELFGASRVNVVEHVRHIYGEGEFVSGVTCWNFWQVCVEGSREVTREMFFYSLVLVISVGYRVRSRVATRFSIWVTGWLCEYLVAGYVLGEHRLRQLGSVVRIFSSSGGELVAWVAGALSDCLPGFVLLCEYDEDGIATWPGVVPRWALTFKEARAVIFWVFAQFLGDFLFGRERDDAFDAVIGVIYQGFYGQDFYPSVEEKAANLLYLLVKDHPLSDGNKRSAAALFVTFLAGNSMLLDSAGMPRITNSALAAITIMVAVSEAKEKNLMVALRVRMIADGAA